MKNQSVCDLLLAQTSSAISAKVVEPGGQVCTTILRPYVVLIQPNAPPSYLVQCLCLLGFPVQKPNCCWGVMINLIMNNYKVFD